MELRPPSVVFDSSANTGPRGVFLRRKDQRHRVALALVHALRRRWRRRRACECLDPPYADEDVHPLAQTVHDLEREADDLVTSLAWYAGIADLWL